MGKIIFNEADRFKTVLYNVIGCEKALVVRSDQPPPYNLDIETMSLSDPHKRSNAFMTITQNGDYNIDMMPLGCGMQLIFKTDNTITPDAHLFVEIIYETCVPEECCACNK